MQRRSLVVLVLAAVTLAVACAAPAATATRLRVTTLQTVCGGTIPPPGEPFCRTNPYSRGVTASSGRTVVASGTSSASGELLLDVPAGRLTVSATDVQAYETCDAPTVDVAANETVNVTQTCTINAP
ncbi:MAG: hypothetical protein ACKOYM_09740 [Actinomycetes bacterium]